MLGKDLHFHREHGTTAAEIAAITIRLKAEETKLGSDLVHAETLYTTDGKEGQLCPSTSKFVTVTIGGEVLFNIGSGGEELYE